MYSTRLQHAGTSTDKRDFILPSLKNTVQAAVLAAMLDGRALTGIDAVYGEHTTRLSAVIYRLEKHFGWHIARRDIAVGTTDGRVAWVRAYWLSQDTRAAAFDAGARQWVEGVKHARTRLRKTAPKRTAEAARINAMRGIDPRQIDLWGAA